MIDWHQIDTVLLDMDGTLLDLHYDNYFWCEYLPDHYAKVHGLNSLQTREQLVNKFRSRIGELEFYCIDHWSNELQMDLLSLKRELDDRITFLPCAIQLLEHLRSLSVDTVLITNAHEKVLEIKQETIGIKDHVRAAYASHQFGLPKENEGFWPVFVEHHPFNPERTLFIDDNVSVLDAAKTFGIEHRVQPLQPDSKKAAQILSDDSPHIQVLSLAQLLPGKPGKIT